MATPHVYDVVVVGARPAGAGTALLLARAGLDVLVLDRETPGRDTSSTHALMRGAVIALQRWGVLDRIVAAGTPPIDEVTFHYEDEPVRVDLRGRGDPLYAPRRTVLDPAIVDAATEAGATFRYRTTVDGVLRARRTGRVIGVTASTDRGPGVTTRDRVLARHVVAADGRNSRLAKRFGAPVLHRGSVAGGVAYRYVEDLPAEGYQWVYRQGRTGGLIPTNGGLTCVWAGSTTEHFRSQRGDGVDAWFDHQLASTLPETADVIRHLPPGRVRGDAGRPSIVRRPWGRGWSLVGDAGAYRDPITSHGITDALRDAELLATALVAILRDGDDELVALSEYHRLRDRFGAPIVALTDRIASYRWDIPTVRELLLDLSSAMREESAFLTARPPVIHASDAA